MCGPIALSISGRPGAGANMGRKLLEYLSYFSGKTITYGLMGLVFGLLGQGFVLAGFQQALSVVMGSVMLLLVLVSLVKISWFHSNKATVYLQNKLVPAFGYLLKKPGSFTPFLLGLLNGLLPCGLVYIGLTASVATGHAIHAALYMILFGAGTIPVMLAFTVFTGQLGFSWRTRIRQLTPVLMALMGTILVLRGLNLGIPYISPLLDALMIQGDRGTEAAGCHP
jgi:sulfite exporter TauE/SafE